MRGWIRSGDGDRSYVHRSGISGAADTGLVVLELLPGLRVERIRKVLRRAGIERRGDADVERDGLVQRTIYPQVPPRVEYALTPLGQTLCEPIAALIRWSEENIDAVTAAQKRYDEVA